MKDYHDLYLKADVLLLSCVFESFRNNSIVFLVLDTTHCPYTPGYSWDTMLRFTDVNLKLISDIEKYQFTESAIMGGIAMISKAYAEVNDKFLKSYDANKPTLLYIIELGSNNL